MPYGTSLPADYAKHYLSPRARLQHHSLCVDESPQNRPTWQLSAKVQQSSSVSMVAAKQADALASPSKFCSDTHNIVKGFSTSEY